MSYVSRFCEFNKNQTLRLQSCSVISKMLGMEGESNIFRDGLVAGPAHRRGAGLNPGNRFENTRLHVLGEELDRQMVEREENGDSGPRKVERTVFYDRTQRIINQVSKTADVPFDWTINPY